MALAPNTDNAGKNQGTNVQNYFTQLLHENQQINVFISDWTLEHAAEEEAEARHRMSRDAIYTEANVHIRSLEAHADAEHTRRLAFVQQGRHVLASQRKLNSFSQGYFSARQTAKRKGKQHSGALHKTCRLQLVHFTSKHR